MSEKLSTVFIKVTGRPMSGKSTVMSQIIHHLKSLGFDLEINWGYDGEPKSHTELDKLRDKTNNVRERSKIVIVEEQLARKQEF